MRETSMCFFQECIHACQQFRIAQICQCYQYHYEFANFNSGNDSDYPACDTGDDYKCMRGVLASFASSVPEECSECRVPCKYVMKYCTSI